MDFKTSVQVDGEMMITWWKVRVGFVSMQYGIITIAQLTRSITTFVIMRIEFDEHLTLSKASSGKLIHVRINRK